MSMSSCETFRNRHHAGRVLAQYLNRYRSKDTVVLALPRGGVPVGYEVARALDAPLDVWVVRKIGAPQQPELGMGAVAEGGELFLDRATMDLVGASDAEVAHIVREKELEVAERAHLFRHGNGPPDVRGKVVVVVDDGIATGATARAALRALRRHEPKRLVLATPVAAADTLHALRTEVDELVCPNSEPYLTAVGYWYDDFAPTSDDEVVELLDRSRRDRAERDGAVHSTATVDDEVEIPVRAATLDGRISIPPHARGVVIFAHGSGSSRNSRRNQLVAKRLQQAGMATLLFDLLTAGEGVADDRMEHLRFNIGFLAMRLAEATNWVRRRRDLGGLPIGYFGASTGAAAAFVVAAEHPELVSVIVSRGGRPDLAQSALSRVRAPTLLIVGGADVGVLRFNREALRRFTCKAELAIVPHATHLFEEAAALEQVAEAATEWFALHLAPAGIEARV
jgi:putative phosphoribosyl transferase